MFKKFMELPRYVDDIKEERVKIQIFLENFPHNYRDKINFSNPQILEEAIRMEMHYYE